MHSIAQLNALYENTFSLEIFQLEPHSLYEPVRHIMATPGKRIRPILLLMAAEAFGGDVSKALHPAFAIEIFHNFTLVHDDIMDKAELRRGRPTVHSKYGLNAGILAGDVMLSYAYKYLSSIDAAYLPRVLEVFNQTTIEIYEGQQMDVDFETRLDVTVDEYLKMIKNKTSVLLACALQIGAIIGGASADDQQKIYDFGLNLGLSFQIKDDWLDTFGEADKVGKRIGGDILHNKKTYLMINALQFATDSNKKKLLAALQKTDEANKIAQVMDVYADCNISELTLAKTEALYQTAIERLDDVSLSRDKKAMLYNIAQAVHQRNF